MRRSSPAKAEGSRNDDDDCLDQACSGGLCAPASSCAELLSLHAGLPDGIDTIDPNGESTADAIDTDCDMSTDGGGWTALAADGDISVAHSRPRTSASRTLPMPSAWTTTRTAGCSCADRRKSCVIAAGRLDNNVSDAPCRPVERSAEAGAVNVRSYGVHHELTGWAIVECDFCEYAFDPTNEPYIDDEGVLWDRDGRVCHGPYYPC